MRSYTDEIKTAKKTLLNHFDHLKVEKLDLTRELRKTDLIQTKIDLEKRILEIDTEISEFKAMFR